MPDVVLDASAVLALLFQEEGADRVADRLPGALISAVNLAEVMTKLADFGMPRDRIETVIGALRLVILPFDSDLALETALLRPRTRAIGLSLGDRACLATARLHAMPALTADKAWSRLGDAVPVTIETLR